MQENDSSRFDTIVVADEANAQGAVGALGKGNSIRVIDLSTNKEWRWAAGAWDERDYPSSGGASKAARVSH